MDPVREKSDQALIGAMVAGGAIIVGSLMPWATVTTGLFSASVTGTDGDGVISLFLGGLLALFAWLARSNRWTAGAVAAIVVSILTVLLALFELVTIPETDEFAHVSTGIGVWVVAIGAVAGVVTSFIAHVNLRQAASEAESEATTEDYRRDIREQQDRPGT